MTSAQRNKLIELASELLGEYTVAELKRAFTTRQIDGRLHTIGKLLTDQEQLFHEHVWDAYDFLVQNQYATHVLPIDIQDCVVAA